MHSHAILTTAMESARSLVVHNAHGASAEPWRPGAKSFGCVQSRIGAWRLADRSLSGVVDALPSTSPGGTVVCNIRASASGDFELTDPAAQPEKPFTTPGDSQVRDIGRVAPMTETPMGKALRPPPCAGQRRPERCGSLAAGGVPRRRRSSRLRAVSVVRLAPSLPSSPKLRSSPKSRSSSA
jgi:hypothetical protein